jgi:hypothetical protein
MTDRATYDEAEDAASRHRGQFGDDVILHSPDDEGSFFACEDCDWICVYDPEPDEAQMQAEHDAEFHGGPV